jgi:hypothetical protein
MQRDDALQTLGRIDQHTTQLMVLLEPPAGPNFVDEFARQLSGLRKEVERFTEFLRSSALQQSELSALGPLLERLIERFDALLSSETPITRLVDRIDRVNVGLFKTMDALTAVDVAMCGNLRPCRNLHHGCTHVSRFAPLGSRVLTHHRETSLAASLYSLSATR